MEYNLDHSDDEMDLLGPSHPPHKTTSNPRLAVKERSMNDEADEEEVTTSDPDELAEVLANRSLEKYQSEGGPVSLGGEDEAESDIGNRENRSFLAPGFLTIRTPSKPNNFRSHSISPSSSPTRLTQASGENYASTEDNAMSEDFPQTSSPDAGPTRYSPPAHLQPQFTQSIKRPSSPSEKEDIPLHETSKSPEFEAGIEVRDKDRYETTSHTGSAMSLVNSPRAESVASLDQIAEQSETSPRQSVPQVDNPLSLSSFSIPTTEQTPQPYPVTAFLETGFIEPATLHAGDNFHPSPPLSSPAHAAPGPASPLLEPVLDAPHGRTLRVRTARQQHPYAFEYANYKNSMRRAGLDDAIVKLQAIEREKALREHGHRKEVQPEMNGFIVPEDEESQDLYVPPATPPPRERRNESAGPAETRIDMEALLAGFGGMISDDESPIRREDRKRKGKEKDSTATKPKPAPKPFPLNTTMRTLQSKSPSAEPGPSTRPLRRLPPSSPAGPPTPSAHWRQTSSPSHPNRKTPTKIPSPPGSSSSRSQSEIESNSDSDSTESSSGSQGAAERKRFRILHKMMPAAWVRRQLEEETRKREAKVADRTRHDLPLRPGQARAKTRVRDPDQPLVLRGDSESDDDDNASRPSQRGGSLPPVIAPASPPARSFIRPRVFPPKRPTQISDDSSGNDIIDLLSADDRSSIVEIATPGVDDEEISSWLAYRSPKRAAGNGRGGGGGDLINRMLSRTNGLARDGRHGARNVRTGYDKDGHKLKQAKLTSMFRSSSPRNGVLNISSSEDDTRIRAKSRSAARKSKNASKAGTKTTRTSKSGRTLTIQGDLAVLLDATIMPSSELNSAKSKTSTHNRAVSTNINIREGNGPSQGKTNLASSPRATKLDNFGHRTASTDSGIVPLRPHTKFSPSTYLARGHLQNLLNLAATAEGLPIEATPAIVFGEHLDTRLTGTGFVDQVRRLVPHWADWLAGRQNETDSNVFRSFRFIALRITYLLESPNEETSEESLEIESESRAFLEEDATEIYKAITGLSLTDPALMDNSSASTPSWLWFHWFVVELAVRIACGNRRRALRISQTATMVSTHSDAAVQRMILSLLGHNLADSIREVYESQDDLNDPILEIWVCLLYLVDETEWAGAVQWKPLWARVELVLDSPDYALPYKVYESERRWEYIFSFSALESFSPQTGRLIHARPPIARWPWVCKTIKDIRLKEDKVVEEAKQRRQRVDYYVRIVTARCWLMHTMWGWSYSQSDRLLNILYPVFQTRKLSKLRDERTDFPAFIRNLDLEHLGRFSNGDTAWSMFLKIFRRAIIDNPASARKLYSAYAPVAVLNFTNENPATDMDLSRLYNSFAMFLVILITDPTFERGADCIRRVQGLMSFKTADMRSREACIRAFQYMGLLFKYYQLEMTPLVSWMNLMLRSLQEELGGSPTQAQRNRLVVLSLCLVRSVAAITSTSGFDHDSKKTYPEVTLLTEDFVRILFQLDLKNNAAARREIKQFLEAFGHARDAFLATQTPKPAPKVVTVEETQESHESYDYDLELNDAEVAGMDAYDVDLPTKDPLAAKELHTAETFHKIISPAIFENMILGFGLDDRRLSSSPERGYDIADESTWIRVWFGCVKIPVENHLSSWQNYLKDWGSPKEERISRIIDVSAERRVRIYFCYLALKHTPTLVQRGSSAEQKHQFLLPWFQCLPHHRYTIEHKYTALICELGLKNEPLLEGLPCKTDDKGGYFVSSSELIAERGDYIRCIFKNLLSLSQSLDNDSSIANFTRARECVSKLLATMQHTRELLSRPNAPSADEDLVPSYLEFCQGVRSSAAEFFTTSPIKDLLTKLSWVPS